MRAFLRNALLSFLVAAAFPVASGTIIGADAVRQDILATPNCPAGTNWDAVLQRCR